MYQILLVEDDRALALAVQKLLESYGSRVRCVEDFADVLGEFAACQPQLVLMDIKLPYRYRKSCHFIDSLRLSHKRWPSPIINHVIARPVRKLVVAIRIPRPQAPLPKGGWHGEAVTGGFFPAPHLLVTLP